MIEIRVVVDHRHLNLVCLFFSLLGCSSAVHTGLDSECSSAGSEPEVHLRGAGLSLSTLRLLVPCCFRVLSHNRSIHSTLLSSTRVAPRFSVLKFLFRRRGSGFCAGFLPAMVEAADSKHATHCEEACGLGATGIHVRTIIPTLIGQPWSSVLASYDE